MSALRDLRSALRRAPLRTLPRRALLRAQYGRARTDPHYLEALRLDEWRRHGATPLHGIQPAADAPLDVAFVVPPFQPGSGGHTTLANLVRGLEARGHACSVWLDDPGGRVDDLAQAALDFAAWFGPFRAAVHADFAAWRGADVAVATGYQSVLRVRTLPDTAARAYLVQDHEPEFFATSAESVHAAESYRLGLHAITAGSWLAEVMRRRYDAPATPFELAVDHALYHPRPEEARREDVVLFYARSATPRRAVPLGLVALRELLRRRPGTEIWLFGAEHAPRLDFPVTNLGVLSGEELARRYAQATVGMCLSLTNWALVPQEMLACGLPCVELATPSVVAAFGADGPVALAEPDPASLTDALERLLGDPAERARRATAGRQLVAERTWTHAAERVEAGLREALARRAG